MVVRAHVNHFDAAFLFQFTFNASVYFSVSSFGSLFILIFLHFYYIQQQQKQHQNRFVHSIPFSLSVCLDACVCVRVFSF